MRAFLLAAAAGLAAVLTIPVSTAGKPRAHWLKGVTITEYYPAPERWFTGRKVRAPDLPGRHRVDWLYSADGIAMEGEGIGLDGRRYHFEAGPKAWVRQDGKATVPRERGGWTRGWPFWREGGWRNSQRHVTFPLEGGGWFDGRGARYIKPVETRFAPGPSIPVTPWKSLAVDPRVIPLGSRVFVPAYCPTRHRGWFRAEDTGGAIKGRHIDVYRTPPGEPDGALAYEGERIYVIPPGAALPTNKPTCSARLDGAGVTAAGPAAMGAA